MELSHLAAVELARVIKKLLTGKDIAADIVVCPSYPSLPAVAEIFGKSHRVGVGAQHVFWEERGAFTGAVSVAQISPFVRWCLVGHSEQRSLTGQTELQVAAAARVLLKHGLTPVVCLGETWDERQRGEGISRVTSQVETLLASLTRPGLAKLVVVYEPVWAISAQGVGEVPPASEVAEMALLIRKLVAERFGAEGADKVRVLYGGSVKPQTARAYVSEPGVDGVLVGNASVNAVQFMEIVQSVSEAW